MSIFDDDLVYDDLFTRSLGALEKFKDALKEYLKRFRRWDTKGFPIKPYQTPSSVCPPTRTRWSPCSPWKAVGVYVPEADSPYINDIPDEIVDKEGYCKKLCKLISSGLPQAIKEVCEEYSIGMYELDAQAFDSFKIRGYLTTITSGQPGVILIRNIDQIAEEEQNTLKSILVRFWEDNAYICRCPYVPIFTTSKGNPIEKPVILANIKELDWYGDMLLKAPWGDTSDNTPLTKKKVMYLHGFASSAASGTVQTLREMLPDFDVVAPDIPVDPTEALPFLRSLCVDEKPDVIVGTSMGGMYAQQLRGYKRICVNPAFEMSKVSTVLKVGVHEYFKPRRDGATHFEITSEIIRHHAEMEAHQFDGITDDDRRQVWGLFADNDQLVNCEPLFLQHYNQVKHFHGEHRLDDEVIETILVPLIREACG